MCGRYTLISKKEVLKERFAANFPEQLTPRYNVAPTQQMPVITSLLPKEAQLYTWGLIPNWALNDSGASNLMNVRAENIVSKATFRQIARSNRCLVIADGYYEWRKEQKLKVPYRITLANEQPFAFAGIWDKWEDEEGKVLYSFGIITTEAQGIVKELHDRMPVILTPEYEKYWLEDKLKEDDINTLLKPSSEIELSYYKTHKVVNSAINDVPTCIEVAPKIYPGETFSLFD